MPNIPQFVDSTKAHPCPRCGQGEKCIQLADGSAGVCGADACTTGHIHFWGPVPVLLMMIDTWLMTFDQDGNPRHNKRGLTPAEKLRLRRRSRKFRRQRGEIRNRPDQHDYLHKESDHDH